ncbi:MAG: iron-sulfur cluster-binding protein [Alphaproteobacteria bacterium]|nr:iron-sulfur cluster-binding protein [Alphaproteobacteria bacterium]
MEPHSLDFKAAAGRALADLELQKSLGTFKVGFSLKRLEAIQKLPEFEDLRGDGIAIKSHTLGHLDFYLERFATNVEAAGGTVHWCPTPDDGRRAILDILRTHGAKTATKSKSMVAEELGLNEFLEANDIEPVETDLGEYIIQLAHERPSHILAPAVHKTKEQVSDLFFEHHKTRHLTEASDMVAEARQFLRPRYLAAGAGITGANFLVAETGSIILVTNEGNAELTQILPKVHIVLATIEKMVPTLEDAATLLRLLARSATGQEFSTYTTVATGPKRAGDGDGPEAFHVILLDNGRSKILGGEFREVLRCIKCAACMNHCPVYSSVGGHAYGWVYPGPIGAALTPNLIGLEEARHLPNASTFCGRCEAVCPMRIPLPKLMRQWREQEHEKKLSPPRFRLGLDAWAFLAKHPPLYKLATGLGIGVLNIFGGAGRFATLPLAKGWTATRDFPAPEGSTFRAAWKKARG